MPEFDGNYVKKLQHIGTQIINTERLVLRPFSLDDADAMYENWASDPAVTKYLTWGPHPSVETSRAVLKEWILQYQKNDYYQWAIVPKNFGKPIGSIAAVKQDDQMQMVHIGYCIGKNFWHKGITSEALAALMAFFFEKVGVCRVEACHDSNNPHSGGVMKKCGMKYEGTLRQENCGNQGIVDADLYAILKEEWEKL